MQQLELENLNLGETNFVVKRITSATPQRESMKTSGGGISLDFRGESSHYEKTRKTPI
jgi:hypothetical protein